MNTNNSTDNSFIEMVFPTPIYVAMIANKKIQEEMISAIDLIKWVVPDHWGKTHKLSTKTFTEDCIELYDLKSFRDSLDLHLKNYCQQFDFPYREYKVSSWFTKFDNGDYGHLHNHSPHDISGVYYFQTNENDGDLYFLSPNPAGQGSLCYEHINREWVHKPYVGKLLLFPGWLYHGIRTNTTNHTRMSFSFNIEFKR
jgi:uncharacterized protein (TIGR02466 family)